MAKFVDEWKTKVESTAKTHIVYPDDILIWHKTCFPDDKGNSLWSYITAKELIAGIYTTRKKVIEAIKHGIESEKVLDEILKSY